MAINYSNFDMQNRINRLLGKKQKANTDDEIEQGEAKSNYPKVLNPFANKAIIKNADRIYTSEMNNATKTLFNAATGTPNIYQKTSKVPQLKITEVNNDNISEAEKVQQSSTKKNTDVDANSLGNLDIATELPKLSVSQISNIIKQYFGNSKIMSENDAQGIYEAQNQSGMSALAMLGIGALESGYGTSNIANKTNNIWGYGATNNNPEGNAHRYSQMSEGAKQFASEFMKTYYNGYGAKSINSAGTGSNPKGMGYAYNDDGSISSTWAPEVSSIMSKFYNTAKDSGDFSAMQATYNSDDTSQNTSQNNKVLLTTQPITNNTIDSYKINGLLGYNGLNEKGSKYFTLSPYNISLLRGEIPTETTTAQIPNVVLKKLNDITSNSTSDISDNKYSDINDGNKIVSAAKKYLGVPYVWGGTSPDGFDCSGLAQYVFSQQGKTIPRTSQEQFKNGTAVDKGNLQPGDLVFFIGSDGTETDPGHVGIYIGDGQFIQAPKTGDVVKVSDLSSRSDYVGARRY